MKLIVYHGSNNIINRPRHAGGRKFSDFGRGFYVITNIGMAKSWACHKVDKSSYVNKYIFNTESLSSLTFDLDLDWLLFIAYNRRIITNEEVKSILIDKYKDIDKYDIIIGPTADDRMFDTLDMFFNNNITLDHCLQALNSMDLDIQYNIRSSKGIEALTFTNHLDLDEIDKEYYINKAKQKKATMENKMMVVRKKFGKVGKYFDEILI